MSLLSSLGAARLRTPTSLLLLAGLTRASAASTHGRAVPRRGMKVVAQVVGLETGDASPSVLVCTDSSKYLFGAGEGLQRFCGEHRARLLKLDAVFLSQVSAARAGGLPGLVLTLADMGRRSTAVFGGPGLHDFCFALRHFMRRDDFALHASEFTAPAATSPSEDSAPRAMRLPPVVRPDLRIVPIMLFSAPAVVDEAASVGGSALDALVRHIPQGAGRRSFEDRIGSARHSSVAKLGHNAAASSAGASCTLTLPLPFQPLTLEALGCSGSLSVPAPLSHLLEPDATSAEASTGLGRTAMSYVCATLPIAGRFHPDRAKALGVPVGPLFGRLSRGEAVEIPILSPRGRPAGAGAEGMPPHLDATAPRLRRIDPHEVKDPDSPGQVIAIVACPSAAFLPALLSPSGSEAFAPYFAASAASCPPVDGGGGSGSPGGGGNVLVVFHATPAVVAATEAYAAWMRRFGPRTQHVMLDHVSTALAPPQAQGTLQARGEPPTMFFHQALQQCKMHVLRPGTFALPQPLPLVAQRQLEAALLLRATAPDAANSLSPLQQIARLRLAEMAVSATAGASRVSAVESSTTSKPVAAISVGSGVAHSLAPFTADVFGTAVLNAPPLLVFNVVPIASQGFERVGSAGSVLGGATAAVSAAAAASASAVASLAASAAAAASSPSSSPAAVAAAAAVIVAPAPLPWLGAVRPDEAIQAMLDDEAMAPHLARALGGAGDPPAASAALHAAAAAVPADAEVLFTGTSSAVPNKYRNVSGIFVRVPAPAFAALSAASSATSPLERRHALMLDCGEGTYGSLVRRLGRTRSAATAADNGGLACADEAVAVLSLLWVSHMHADHHLGALRLIGERAAARCRLGLAHRPLLIIGPTRLYFWLLEASRVEAALAGQWRFADAEHFVVVPTPVPAPMAAAGAGDGEPRSSDDEAAREAGGARSAFSGHGGLKRPRPPSPAPALVPGATQIWSAAPSSPLSSSPSSSVAAAADAAMASDSEGGEVGEDGGEVCAGAASVTEAEGAGGGASALPFEPGEASSRRPATHMVAAPADDGCASAGEAEAGSPVPAPAFSLTGRPASRPALRAEHLADGAFVDRAARDLGLTALRCVRVRHCNKAYGVRLEIVSAASGAKTSAVSESVGFGARSAGEDEGAYAVLRAHAWSLVYSGDTRPCAELVALGRGGHRVAPLAQAAAAGRAPLPTWHLPTGAGEGAGADASLAAAAEAAASGCSLLIHEATFEDDADGRANALAKRHSTAAEACAVAADVGAQHTLLTHFSARYPKLPVLKVGAGESKPTAEAGRTVFVAYDLMRVTGRDLPHLPALLPALHALFKEDEEEQGGERARSREREEG